MLAAAYLDIQALRAEEQQDEVPSNRPLGNKLPIADDEFLLPLVLLPPDVPRVHVSVTKRQGARVPDGLQVVHEGLGLLRVVGAHLVHERQEIAVTWRPAEQQSRFGLRKRAYSYY